VKPSSKLTVVVSLRINRACEAEFEQFEAAAAQIMRRHGGAIERRIRFVAQSAPPPRSSHLAGPQASTPLAEPEGRSLEVKRAQDAPPDEIHIVTFPDVASFDRYRADPDLKNLATLRSRAIRATTVWRGFELPPFLP
jgi:hypothetical protein